MLAIPERLVLDAGLDWVFCDTDSMAIAKPDGVAEAEFRARVEAVREWFAPLNPYAEKGSLLKLEEANYGLRDDGKPTTERAPLYCFAVSAKRYALFNRDPNGRPVLRKASAHGLGHLLPPYGDAGALSSIPAPIASGRDLGVGRWQHDVWYRIVSAALAGRSAQVRLDDLPGFGAPAVSRYAATTPHLLRWFRRFNCGKPYREQVRPFGFLLAFQGKGMADWQDFDLGPIGAAGAGPARTASRSGPRSRLHVPRAVAPFDRDLRAAAARAFDRETGAPVPPNRLKGYRRTLARYHLHPEAKFLGGDYAECGATRRRHAEVVAVHLIGKEANRWEEQFHLGADPTAQSEYGATPEGRERMLAAIREAAKMHGGQTLARETGLSRQHLTMILTERRHPADALLARLAVAAVALDTARRQRDDEAQSALVAVRDECRRLGLRRFARKAGIDDGHLARLLAGSRQPSPAMLAKLHGAMAGSPPATDAAITHGEPGDHAQQLG